MSKLLREHREFLVFNKTEVHNSQEFLFCYRKTAPNNIRGKILLPNTRHLRERTILHSKKACIVQKFYFLFCTCNAIICFIVRSIPSDEPSINITLPFPNSAKCLMVSVHIWNIIIEASKPASCNSFAESLIPRAADSRNNVTPSPRICMAWRSASALILSGIPTIPNLYQDDA